MTWNHRVIRYPDNTYGIHEVYYDENHEPILMTFSAVGPAGDSLVEILETLTQMAQAVDKPILDYHSFRKET